MNRPLSGQMTMWCSPNPRNDFAEIILAYASSSGGAFPSKRQWQMPPSSAITVEVTATDSHRLPSHPLQRDPLRATAKPTISNFQAVPSGNFYCTPLCGEKQFRFCDFRKRALLRHAECGRRKALSPLLHRPEEASLSAALYGKPSPKEDKPSCLSGCPPRFSQTKRRPCGLRLWILFQIFGTGSGSFSEATTVTMSQRALSSSEA